MPVYTTSYTPDCAGLEVQVRAGGDPTGEPVLIENLGSTLDAMGRIPHSVTLDEGSYAGTVNRPLSGVAQYETGTYVLNVEASIAAGTSPAPRYSPVVLIGEFEGGTAAGDLNFYGTLDHDGEFPAWLSVEDDIITFEADGQYGIVVSRSVSVQSDDNDVFAASVSVGKTGTLQTVAFGGDGSGPGSAGDYLGVFGGVGTVTLGVEVLNVQAPKTVRPAVGAIAFDDVGELLAAATLGGGIRVQVTRLGDLPTA